ncbi:MAG: ribosome recycling factor [Chlorobi bacterium]|nr:ribosome recycling factor [Chlorobiota bacterium]
MEDDVQFYLDDAKERMDNTILHLDKELLKIRAGKANPQMLDGIMVDYYGSLTPLNQVSNVNVPDPRTIKIQPWEKAMITPIEKAIMAANIGLNPSNNGELVIINVPILTEERRHDLVKQVKQEGETGKISIRNTRREIIEEFKKLKKEGLSEDMERDAEDDIQKLHDEYIKKIEVLISEKEKDIMTV